MSKTLVIVESPTKAKTIGKFLGSEYRVESSMGHVRDLPPSRMGVDIEGGTFEPEYEIPDKKKKKVAELRKLAKEVNDILFATDEDREGEAISWHLAELLKIKPKEVKRLVFHEITKRAIEQALANPRPLDQHLTDAQQARRVLDRLVGYELSPLLWKKVHYGLSAGRVQSVAVHLVVEREKERAKFRSASYFDIIAQLKAIPPLIGEDEGGVYTFEARLISYQTKPIPNGKDFDADTGALKQPEKFALLDINDATALAKKLLETKPWTVTSVTETPYQTNPYPPFITSTLQQEGARKLGWGAKHTMRVAQSLYEQGYITYMRTDSVILSDQAITAAREAAREFGAEYVSVSPKQYGNKAKLAQEAHEAIRPAGDSFRHPTDVAREADADEAKLYDLIWKRTVASQMKSAEMMRLSVKIAVADAEFEAKGKRILFAGYLRAYVEGSDEPEAELEDQEISLPALKEGQAVDPLSVEAQSHETQPPARYTEASLIKKLEAEGVGRPSTYASILDTIMEREYVTKLGSALVPTFTAMIVDEYLQRYFGSLFDIGFTAKMEGDLDNIAEGKTEWQPYIKNFYFGNGQLGFHPEVEKVSATDEYPVIPLGSDPQTKLQIIIKSGKFGPYIQRGVGGEGNNASIPETLTPSEVTLAKALELLSFKTEKPKALANDAATGKPITYRTGRFGSYLQLGEDEDKKKAKKVSLTYGPKHIPISTSIAPDNITPEQAQIIISLPRQLGDDSGTAIAASVGRFGPYVKRGDDFRSIPKDMDILTITLEQAKELLAREKQTRRKSATVMKELGPHPKTGKPVQILSGRYGPYVSIGTRTFASLPKDTDPESVTLADALRWIEEKKAKKKK